MRDYSIKMTVEELSEAYGYSKSTIETKFKKTAQSFRKKYGLNLIKCKDLDGVFYEVSPLRAPTLYEESKEEICIPFDSIKMDSLACLIIIGIAATQFYVFKGTRKEFLDYLGLPHSKRNIELLNQTLKTYGNKQGYPLIISEEGQRIIISFEEMYEKQQILTKSMLIQCREIARKYNKQAIKVVQLIKVWQAYRINQYKGVNPLTDDDLQKYIDLSKSQILDAKKMLVKENIIKLDRVGTPDVRIGTFVSSNVYYDNKRQVIKE